MGQRSPSTDDTIIKIKVLYLEGLTISELSKEFNLPNQTIKRNLGLGTLDSRSSIQSVNILKAKNERLSNLAQEIFDKKNAKIGSGSVKKGKRKIELEQQEDDDEEVDKPKAKKTKVSPEPTPNRHIRTITITSTLQRKGAKKVPKKQSKKSSPRTKSVKKVVASSSTAIEVEEEKEEEEEEIEEEEQIPIASGSKGKNIMLQDKILASLPPDSRGFILPPTFTTSFGSKTSSSLTTTMPASYSTPFGSTVSGTPSMYRPFSPNPISQLQKSPSFEKPSPAPPHLPPLTLPSTSSSSTSSTPILNDSDNSDNLSSTSKVAVVGTTIKSKLMNEILPFPNRNFSPVGILPSSVLVPASLSGSISGSEQNVEGIEVVGLVRVEREKEKEKEENPPFLTSSTSASFSKSTSLPVETSI